MTNKMTPKEKANELVDKFYQRLPLKMDVITIRGGLSWEYDNWEEAKQCALIMVDELIRIAPWGSDIDDEIEDDSKEYYIEVKEEIEKL
jgi:hypothetical protein